MKQATIAFRKVTDESGLLPPVQTIKCKEHELNGILEMIKSNDDYIYIHTWVGGR